MKERHKPDASLKLKLFEGKDLSISFIEVPGKGGTNRI